MRLRFTRECLGFARRKLGDSRGVIYGMPRNANRDVMFLASWWRENLQYAAKVVNRHHNTATKVAWDQVVDGKLSEWRRTVTPAKEGKRARYALHEAFRPNTIIGVNAVLPDGLTIDEFIQLLEIVGTYKGISPFKSDTETYGTFEVVSVMKAVRGRH